MALYKYTSFITQADHAEFDKTHKPGFPVPILGFIAAKRVLKKLLPIRGSAPDPLPPQNHHQHAPGAGAINWRLPIFANHNPN
jgi:hypothetical protein